MFVCVCRGVCKRICDQPLLSHTLGFHLSSLILFKASPDRSYFFVSITALDAFILIKIFCKQ